MVLLAAAALLLGSLLPVRYWPGVSRASRREMQIDVGVIGGLAAATLGFFWRLITGEVWMPAGGGDLAGFLYPTYHFAAEWWRRGVIPLWNPHLFAGQPFLGDIQSGIFYPLNLLTFFLTDPLTFRDLELLSVLHYVIAGVGMYSLLRWGDLFIRPPGLQLSENTIPELPSEPATGLSRTACVAGAITFEFSDVFVTHFGNLNLIAAAAWLPIVFMYFSRALNRRSYVDAALAGIFLAVAFLAGHIQTFLFILLSLGLYALYSAVENRRDIRQILGLFLLMVVIGFGLAAPVFLPAIEMSRASVRNFFSYDNAAQFSLPPAELVGLLVPGFFGRGVQASWAPWPRVEVGYVGVLPLITAGLALILRRSSRTLFFALLALIGLGLALGGYAILHGWLYALVPGFGQLRAPARFVLLLDFGLAILAAAGLDTLIRPLTTRQNAVFRSIIAWAPWASLIFAVAASAVALSILILGQGQDPVLFQRIAGAVNGLFFFVLLLLLSLALLVARAKNAVSPLLAGALAVTIIFFDLFSLGAYVDAGAGDPTAAYNRQDVIDFFASRPGYYRVDSMTDAQGTWQPDTAALFGLYDVNGDNPLILSDFALFWQALRGRASPAYNLLNIRYVIAKRSTPLENKFERVADVSGGLALYQNRDEYPRAWTVTSTQSVPAHSEVLALLNEPSTDPYRTIILESSQEPKIDTGEGPRAAEITGYGPNEVDLRLTGNDPARFLFLSEVYYPGWRAFVDGNETEVLRADYVFRAIAIPAGAHTVRFAYDPPLFRIGLALSGLTLLGMVGWGTVRWIRGRRFKD